MNQRGLTRGDGLVFVCVALIFGMSFAPYFKASVDGSGGFGDDDRSSRGDGDTLNVNAWAQDHWPLMAVVILLPLISFVLLVTHRYMVNADQRPVGGLTLRQWATSFAVVAAWAALWSLGGNAFGNLDDSFESGGGNLEHGFGAFVILPFALIMALLLIVIDRVPGLAYPLFITAPVYPPGYIPQQPGQPGQPGYGTGMYAQPVVPPGTPVAHMPPPMTHGAGMPAVPQASGPVPSSGSGPGSGPGSAPGSTPAPSPAPAATPTATPAPAAPAPAPAPDFEQFWLAVPAERPLLPLGGLDKTPVATLVPGSWYLAVEPAGDGLVVEVDGVRGVLWDTSGIQRGE